MVDRDDKRVLDESERLRQRARALIPGGAHTYAKGDDQFPVDAPGVIVRGDGCHAWDADGNEYIEYGMGLRSVTLGHAYEPVIQRVAAVLSHGTNYTRPAALEGECAEAVLELIDGAEQVKFAKDGSTVTTAAIRLARAHTGRPLVAFCHDHPFFSYNDWFIGHSPMDAGIPAAARDLTATFRYNDIVSLEAVFAANPGQVACVILEPERETPPGDNFLMRVQELCRREGAVFILDEMITGFRWHRGGAQAVYGLDPDLSAFGKGLGNGFAISALVGKRHIMELGGFDHDRERVFLLSTTHGAESVGLAAALATIDVYQSEDVVGRLHRQGQRLRLGVEQVARARGLESAFWVSGRDCNLVFATCDAQGERSQLFRTLFMQQMVRRGILGPSFVVSYSHSDDDIDRTIEAVDSSLAVYREALDGDVHEFLHGRPVQPAMRRRH